MNVVKMNANVLRTTALITVFVASALWPAAPASAAPDVCTWNGSASSSWSNGANWSGCDNGGVPENGDNLVFPAGAANLTNNNDIVGLDVDTVIVSGNNYVFSGNALDITPTSSGGLTFTGSNNNWSVNTTFNDTLASPSLVSSASANSVGANVVLTNGGNRDFFVGVSGVNVLTISGPISGTTRFFTSGSSGGTTRLAGLNTFTTTSSIQFYAESFVCESASCFGNASNEVQLYNGAILTFDTAANISNPIRFAAPTARLRTIDQATNISSPITVNPGTSAVIEPGTGAALGLFGTVNNDGTLNFGGAADVAIFGVASGSGHFLSNNSLAFLAENTFTGDVIINSGGKVNAFYADSLGVGAGVTYVSAGGSIVFSPAVGSISVAEDFLVEGTGAAGTGGAISLLDNTDDVTLTGTVELLGDTTISNYLVGTQSMYISGAITGTGNLLIQNGGGSGAVVFIGTSVNSYVGTTTVRGSNVTLAKSAGGVGITGNVNVEATAVKGAYLYMGNNGGNQLWDGSTITLTNSGAFVASVESSLDTEVVGTVVGNGHIESDGFGFGFTVGGNDVTGTFNGSFDNEDGIITKIGTGTWDLSGASFPGGPVDPFVFVHNGGTIVWNSVLVGIPITVNAGALLKGTGTVGATVVNSGGTVNVGNSPGCMTMESLTLNSGSVFTQEIAGAAACGGYDQTTVTGAAVLGNATLTILPTYTPVDGTVFTILTAGSVSGEFQGMPNGSTVVVGGISFRINYTATSVTLTKLAGTVSLPAAPNTGFEMIAPYGPVVAFMFGVAAMIGGYVYRIRSRLDAHEALQK